jgi:glycosyltransferase involved in cell wall biosynthesis
MMRLFINGTAASAGGGLTYLRNVLPHLSLRNDIQTTVAIDPNFREFIPKPSHISFVESLPYGPGRRFLWEQSGLRKQIQSANADVLLSAGNFAMRDSPVPQVLLSGNSLYLSRDFRRDLMNRWEYRTMLEHRLRSFLAKRSIAWADCTVAPSQAFANELRQWTKSKKIVAIHHGFDHDMFFRDQSSLPVEIGSKLNAYPQALRLLFVSHYNYYRNFETLFRALSLLQNRLGKDVKLFLTCDLQPNQNPGSYRVQRAVDLIQELDVSDNIVELGQVPNHFLHHVYRACHLYVTASYAETFAHPLVEAMACGLPVIASDLSVHQEVCGDAAVYFDRFSPQDLAQCIVKISSDKELLEKMPKAGQIRSHDFSWGRHVEELMAIMKSLCSNS